MKSGVVGSAGWRALIFCLASSSIGCLLCELYGLWPMHRSCLVGLIPATVVMLAIAAIDRARGKRRIFKVVVTGAAAGLCGTAIYNLARLPFGFSEAWGLKSVGFPHLPLFKVIPAFGSLIGGDSGPASGSPIARTALESTSWRAHALGWAYHVSNGVMFGVMFAAVRDIWSNQNRSRRSLVSVVSAVGMSVGIEVGLLLSPYAEFFDIRVTPEFVAVTMAAHVAFGLGLGACYSWLDTRWSRQAEHLVSHRTFSKAVVLERAHEFKSGNSGGERGPSVKRRRGRAKVFAG